MRTLLMAEHRCERTFGYEAEPVIVQTDDPRLIILLLDDGRELRFDALELRAAVAARSREAA